MIALSCLNLGKLFIGVLVLIIAEQLNFFLQSASLVARFVSSVRAVGFLEAILTLSCVNNVIIKFLRNVVRKNELQI